MKVTKDSRKDEGAEIKDDFVGMPRRAERVSKRAR